MRAAKNHWLVFGVVVVAVLLAGGTVLIRQAHVSEAIELANGKMVYLGQTADNLTEQFGDEIAERADMPGVFRYPSDYGRPAQANVYMESGKVVGVIVGRETGHQYWNGKIRVGSNVDELRNVFGSRLTEIDTANGPVRQSGYQVDGNRSVKLFITETCLKKSNEQVVVMALTRKNAVNRLTYINRPLDCSKASAQQSS
jgi:hypothetical protein